MSREIKFRAWDKDNEEMFFVPQLIYIPGKGMQVLETGSETKRDDCLLMQFTGLKDKNGKEIYEGDIIREGILEDGRPLVSWVKFEEGAFTTDDGEFLSEAIYGLEEKTNTEVIGNIYENPQLLK
jgi:uncharacterized phage protein (TIGR01671 family)